MPQRFWSPAVVFRHSWQGQSDTFRPRTYPCHFSHRWIRVDTGPQHLPSRPIAVYIYILYMNSPLLVPPHKFFHEDRLFTGKWVGRNNNKVLGRWINLLSHTILSKVMLIYSDRHMEFQKSLSTPGEYNIFIFCLKLFWRSNYYDRRIF